MNSHFSTLQHYPNPTYNQCSGQPDSLLEGGVGLAKDDYPNLAALYGITQQNSGSDWMRSAMSALGSIPVSNSLPTFSYSDVQESESHFDKRHTRLKELLPIRPGRTIPDDDDLMIGDARSLKLAVLFLDICKFSTINSETLEEQTRVLTILNLFMAEMLRLIKKDGGEFEKNTGDGLMAYFKNPSPKESAKVGLETAIALHFFNDNVITPKLGRLGIPPVSFRVGLEVGDIVLANVGVRGDHHSIVAVGTTANVACKMMKLIDKGGIVIGHHTKDLLPDGWSSHCSQVGNLPGFVISGTHNPYPIWSFNYRAPSPINYFGSLSGIF